MKVKTRKIERARRVSRVGASLPGDGATTMLEQNVSRLYTRDTQLHRMSTCALLLFLLLRPDSDEMFLNICNIYMALFLRR